MYIGLHIKCLLFLLHSRPDWILAGDFVQVFEVRAEMFHADRLTNGLDETDSRLWQLFCVGVYEVVSRRYCNKALDWKINIHFYGKEER